jgi:hypothetical protein
MLENWEPIKGKDAGRCVMDAPLVKILNGSFAGPSITPETRTRLNSRTHGHEINALIRKVQVFDTNTRLRMTWLAKTGFYDDVGR